MSIVIEHLRLRSAVPFMNNHVRTHRALRNNLEYAIDAVEAGIIHQSAMLHAM